MARRDELRKALTDEWADLRESNATCGDSADAAFDSGSEEMSAQLAEFESRELNQIDRALTRLKQGTYGVCELCQKKISVARLNAVPYGTTCIECQREMESYPGGNWRHDGGDWAKICEARPAMEEQGDDLDVGRIEADLAHND
jgi:DnaK suppressor protein